MKKQDFYHKALMQQQNYTHIGLQKFIEMAMEYLHQTEYFLIMRVQEEVKHLLQKR